MTYEDTRNTDVSARLVPKRRKRDRIRRVGAMFRWREGLPVTTREAADILGCSYSTLRERIRAGGVKQAGTVGRAKAYFPDDLVVAALGMGRCH